MSLRFCCCCVCVRLVSLEKGRTDANASNDLHFVRWHLIVDVVVVLESRESCVRHMHTFSASHTRTTASTTTTTPFVPCFPACVSSVESQRQRESETQYLSFCATHLTTDRSNPCTGRHTHTQYECRQDRERERETGLTRNRMILFFS